MGTKTLSAAGEVAQVVTLDDPKGRSAYEKLSNEAREHLRLFGMSRPGFDLAIIDSQAHDEDLTQREPGKVHRQAPLHWYQAGTIYMVGALKPMQRTSMQILDIGSPIEQQLAICAMDGVVVSVVDVRPRWYPDILPFTSITGSATALPVPDARFDVVTSNCVLCHVGDGRYGDKLDVDGDVNMLRECKRVLLPGGKLLIGIGPMWSRAHILFNHHRVYSHEWALKLFKWAGLRVTDFWVYNVETGQWMTPDLMDATRKKVVTTYYGFAQLEKPVW
jgi:SAM-dependent methyltransferase